MLSFGLLTASVLLNKPKSQFTCTQFQWLSPLLTHILWVFILCPVVRHSHTPLIIVFFHLKCQRFGWIRYKGYKYIPCAFLGGIEGRCVNDFGTKNPQLFHKICWYRQVNSIMGYLYAYGHCTVFNGYLAISILQTTMKENRASCGFGRKQRENSRAKLRHGFGMASFTLKWRQTRNDVCGTQSLWSRCPRHFYSVAQWNVIPSACWVKMCDTFNLTRV